MKTFIQKFCSKLAGLQLFSVRILRIAIAIVLLWIGGLKYYHYESEGIAAYVANSPLMRFFYAHPDEYKQHEMKEGAYSIENNQWHQMNHTHSFGQALGIVIVFIGIALVCNYYSTVIGMIAAILLMGMCCVTLSFLITTPEAWVPALGDPAHGFPLLAAKGRLVVKDVIMLAGAFVALCDSAKAWLAAQTDQQ